MKLRPPAIPLITVDPYFSVWSKREFSAHGNHDLNRNNTWHWTGSPNTMLGTVTVDGVEYRFLGKGDEGAIQQVSMDVDALSTTAVYANDKIELTAKFTTPIMADDLYYTSRPVSYLHLSYRPLDGKKHSVTAKVWCSEELVLNLAGEGTAVAERADIDGVTCIKYGNSEQKVLWRDGDDIRIDWGYLYLGVKGDAKVGSGQCFGLNAVFAETSLDNSALFIFAYDDIDSILCFGKHLKAYWKKNGKTICDAIAEAAAEYDALMERCNAFSDRLHADAVKKGGEKYADLVELAYRQVMAGHKLVVNSDGSNFYISKECFSNGCAATVDVTYPSAPMYLYYNTELLKGMIRPVMAFARSDMWQFDFAPHDVGRYPFIDGQRYAPDDINRQMPVEECGNLIILTEAVCTADNDDSFARDYIDLLDRWNEYLIKYGADPQNQLCTDDFAGHMPHNCNLSIKAIMGIAAYSRIQRRLGNDTAADKYMDIAREYAKSMCERAQNPDGSYRLAYDRQGTFSLKYNAVWDKLWGLDLLPERFYHGEIFRYKKEALPYGVPLDSRRRYTKSDWQLWAACLADNRADFDLMVDRLWNAFNTTRVYLPMTDWYFADTADIACDRHIASGNAGFAHRTVQGGLFLKLLFD